MGKLEADIIKETEMKGNVKKKKNAKTSKLLETKLLIKNQIKWINTQAVSLVRYSEPFLNWTRKEKQQNEKINDDVQGHTSEE